jgi:hypothetical protein
MPRQEHSPSRESDRVEAELRHQILTLELEPGLAISESSLMQRYGWGRTPLREAFQRLAEQSLLQIIPRQGAVVTALSVFDFVEMMDAMSLVIGPAAALACKRLSEQDLVQLEAITARAETSATNGDFASLADLDYEFHRIYIRSPHVSTTQPGNVMAKRTTPFGSMNKLSPRCVSVKQRRPGRSCYNTSKAPANASLDQSAQQNKYIQKMSDLP